jgi:son of sevenless-like protein
MVRLKVCGVLKQWLEKHYSDFCVGPHALLGAITQFLAIVRLDHPVSAAHLSNLVDKKGMPRAATVLLQTPEPHHSRGYGLGGFDAEEVARQLALMEFEWFRQILPTELLNKAWINSKADAPNICCMITRSNTIPFWVATEIVQRDNIDERVAILRKFIYIADHCRALNNYNALMEILSGLNMTAIYRLKKTWGSLSPKTLAIFQSLNQLMSPDANFKAYRELLKKVTQPRVPYLGRYLTDLVFTEDAMPLYLENGLIHFWKCKAISQIVLDLTSHQKQPYMLAEVTDIQCYLQKCRGLTESALLKLSRKLEPKVS